MNAQSNTGDSTGRGRLPVSLLSLLRGTREGIVSMKNRMTDRTLKSSLKLKEEQK